MTTALFSSSVAPSYTTAEPCTRTSGAVRRVSTQPPVRSTQSVSLSARNNINRNGNSLILGSKQNASAFVRQTHLRCVAEEAAAAPSTGGTAVRNTSMLVVGATGTVGRQVVRKALDEGYDVRCIVRSRPAPADFLRDWGAQTVRADLSKPETLPPALVGIHTIIDCSTARPEESIKDIDWEGKKALIQSAKAMGIQRYVFFSIEGCEEHQEVPLLEIKRCTELYLEEVGMDYTILRCCGFMQALIGAYAVPILEEQEVWGTDDSTRTAYLDTQDVARMALAAVTSEKTIGKTLTLAGPKAYTIGQVIQMCSAKAKQDAEVKTVPLGLLKGLRIAASGFQWTAEAGDRLAFSEMLGKGASMTAPMDETYELLGLDPSETTTLDSYLDDFYSRILKKLKEVGGESRQKDFYL